MLGIRDILTHPDVDPEGPKTSMDPTDPETEHWYIYIILQRQKVIKKIENSRNHGFSYYFCSIGRIPIRTCD
jgi:hypothetical protein